MAASIHATLPSLATNRPSLIADAEPATTTALVTGAASGLGAAFVEALAQRSNVKLICVDIQQTSSHVRASSAEYIQVDLSSEASVKALVARLEGRRIDLVVHSAGVRGLVAEMEREKPDDVAACETVQVMDVSTMLTAFSINAGGTFLLLQALLPNLALSHQPKVVVMTSRMGSLSCNQLPNKAAGGAYAYRASKAASNMIVRSLAVDVPSVAFILCHPGRVKSNLVRGVEEGAISAEESVRDMLPLIEKWSQRDSGKFFDRFGQVIEW